MIERAQARDSEDSPRVLQRQEASLAGAGRFREALPLAQRWVEVEPSSAAAQRELGLCYSKTGRPVDALKHFTRAINLDPNNPNHYNDFGLVCLELGLLAEAQGAFQQVLRLSPRSAAAYTHLALLASLTGLHDVAVSLLRKGLEADPNCAEAQNNLALLLREQGEQELCRQSYLQAMRLAPGSTGVFSGYLLSLNDDPNADPAWVAAEHRRFQPIAGRKQRRLGERDRDPSRRLRVGYLSADFCTHPVGFFIAPVIEQHDREAFEVVCYSTGRAEDGITKRIMSASQLYRKVHDLSDDQLAEMITGDGIDVLVDLSGHTSGNRLAMMASRVAPIQVTYLGYPNTTGLADMDYRISDAVADPPGQTEAWHTEKLIRVAGGFLAYQPILSEKDVESATASVPRGARVTFGSFNNLAKLNQPVLDTWAEILERVPESSIVIKAKGMRGDSVKTRILKAFAAHGVEGGDRIRLLGHQRTLSEHFCLYHEVDVALDTFPYNGTTTTCEALWMGVPVLTFEGRSHAGRVGASLLTHAGLPELVAKDRAGYVEAAVSLARDKERLAQLRSGLRARLAKSPAMDTARLTRGLEAAYREAWQKYCTAPG